MADDANAPGVGDGNAVSNTAPANDSNELSVEEAMALYAQSEPKDIDDGEGADDPAAAEVEKQLAAKEAADADPEKAPSEDTEEAEPEELPPIERPRSWSKDDDDDWNALPRERQEKIASNERAREADIRQRINEAAETLKGAKAKEQEAEQARKAYEAKLPEVERQIQDFLSNEYPDIKTMADVEKLAREDPFRKMQWDTHQQKIALVMADANAAKERQARDYDTTLKQYQADETSKLAEFVPDVKDPAKFKDLTDKAIAHLKSFDFADTDLAKFASQGDKPFIFSAGFQRILLNSLKYEALQKAPPKAIPKPLPPVQRPGAAKPAGTQNAQNIQALTRRLDQSGSVDDAFALFEAQRRA
jgi:hypothetical protein